MQIYWFVFRISFEHGHIKLLSRKYNDLIIWYHQSSYSLLMKSSVSSWFKFQYSRKNCTSSIPKLLTFSFVNVMMNRRRVITSTLSTKIWRGNWLFDETHVSLTCVDGDALVDSTSDFWKYLIIIIIIIFFFYLYMGLCSCCYVT